MMHRTLAQERRTHWLTIDLGNYCGQPSDTPGGLRGSSLPANVSCPDCIKKMQGIDADQAATRMAEAWQTAPRDMPLDEDGT